MIKKILIGGVIIAGLVAIGVAAYTPGPSADARNLAALDHENEEGYGNEGNGYGQGQGRGQNEVADHDTDVDHETDHDGETGQGYGQGGEGRGQSEVADHDTDVDHDGETGEGYGQDGEGRGQGGEGRGQGQGLGREDSTATRNYQNSADHDDADSDHQEGLPPATNTEPLSQAETDALLRALDDEYHAWSIYNQVLLDFGQARPFSNIIRSEEQHITMLTDLLNRYGIAVPENPWLGNVPQFEALGDACSAAVDAEIANAALYDDLFASTERGDILTVYQDLQAASLQRHLIAFERCATQ